MGALTAFGLWRPAVAQAKDIAFSSWGGVTQEAQAAAWATPFTAKTGVNVLQDGPIDYGKLKAMVEAGNVTWDVVDIEQDFAIQSATQGMFEPLDFTVINKADLDPRFSSDYFIGSFYYAFVIGYGAKAFGSNVPAGWKDLFDLEKFPGKRAYYKWVGPGVYEIPLLADGVKPDELYPLDVDRALKKLDQIKSQIIWWGTGAQSQQLLASGETPIGMFWSGRLYSLLAEGADIGVSWDQNITAADVLAIPKGSKNKDMAMQFLAIAASAEGQAEITRRLGYPPMNPKSLELLDKSIVENLPTKYEAQNIPLNVNYWAENRDMLGKRWYDWQAA